MSTDSRKYSLRPQARPTGESSLEGGIRVFMAPADMAQEGFSNGDFISIQSESTGSTIVAIVSRATDNIGGGHKGLGNPVIRISEYLRCCLSFELKDRYTVEKWTGKRNHISSITLTNVAVDDRPSKTNIDPGALESWTTIALNQLEGIYVSGTFEVTPFEQGERRRRQRFLVEHIEPPPVDKEIMTPYYFDYRSKVKFRDMNSPIESPVPRGLPAHEFNFDGLRGINKELKRLEIAINLGVMTASVPTPKSILIVGSPGTGKSTILDCLSSASWNKVFFIDSTMVSSISSKTVANLAKVFDDAIAREPSLIVIDNIEVIAGKDCPEFAMYLGDHMKQVRNRRVQIVSTARRRIDLHDRIAHRFAVTIELSIPNVKTRFQILQDFGGQFCGADVLSYISEKTHAFSVPNLWELWSTASISAQEQAVEAAACDTPKSEETFVSGKSTNGVHHTDVQVEVTKENFDDALRSVHASAMNEVYVEIPKVQWSDIGGAEKVKKHLNEMTRFGLHSETESLFQVKPNRGILLYGPPGCSKTLLAKAFATESKLNFISIKGHELISKFVGDTESNIREVFRKARAASPSVIFFDEFDSMARRETGHVSLSPVTALLTEMDGFEDLSGVFVLAATNRPQVIDHALLRPGRFGLVMYVGPPNENARQQIIKINLKEKPVSNSLDLEDLSDRTDGWSGAEVAELCRFAALNARNEWFEDRSRRVVISMKHFEAAFKEVHPRLSQEMLTELQEWTVRGIDKAFT